MPINVPDTVPEYKTDAQTPNPFGQTIAEFLEETAPLLEQLEALPAETAAELYDMYEDAARAATRNIAEIDPELRVRLCDGLDSILERIVDLSPALKISQRAVYTPAVQDFRTWQNQELMKDKGLAGYTLARLIGAKPVMFFGSEPSDYPYLPQLPGLELVSGNGGEEAYAKHLSECYTYMDTLILHGMYKATIGYLEQYRILRPDGKVYCGLDMNSIWMNSIDWNNELLRQFAARCDITATSCRFIRDTLNRNPDVNFPCRWFPNGFYNPTGEQVIAGAYKKENIILTVARLGIKVKNNKELMSAFALAADALPGWTLRFVGGFDPRFQIVIDSFFSQHPGLKGRVVFTGEITDKAKLYEEYAKAKVFALTSLQEGGAPNVYAEALFHGCMFVTSDIDAADDITNYGQLGTKYKIGDADALASALVKMCRDADEGAFERHIPKALAYAKRYFDWNRNAKKLAYMLYR